MKCNETMKRLVRYIYYNGFVVLALRLIGVRVRRDTMTIWQMFAEGVWRVGCRGLIPTRKSWKIARICENATKIRIFLTVPEWWGGGAVYYLNEQIKAFERGVISLVVSPAGIGQMLTVRVYDGPDKIVRFLIDNMSALHYLPHGKVEDVVVSTIVAWHDVIGLDEMNDAGIEKLMHQILSVKHATGCKLLYLLHDYYCFCPRLFLVPYEGHYCAKETDVAACVACCKNGVRDCDIIASGTDAAHWREVMVKFLSEADEIRAFCEDTVRRMKQVFPQFDYTLVPHPEPTAIKRKAHIKFDDLRVGIIGNISRYKGVAEVIKLAQYLSKVAPDVRIVVIGKLCADNIPNFTNVYQTGRYDPVDLPNLVEKYGINVAFFSSTFPETFSYVMHEIVQLGLPVVSYDRGAQRDCAQAYEYGMVIPETTPEATWVTIQNLYRKMKNRNGRLDNGFVSPHKSLYEETKDTFRA